VSGRLRKIGLARALSKLGFCSRSHAAELIRGGHVRLNGSARRDPETPVSLGRDRILVDGHTIHAEKRIYLMMNKPRGLVTTASDEKGRETVYESVRKVDDTLPWLAPVGRLDKASEGLLLMTNDSEWGARLADPETHLEKTYHVQIASSNGMELAGAVKTGVISDGELLRVRDARVLRTGEKNCWLEIILDEGRNRQIRRMLAGLQVEVLRLVRVAIGPLPLGTLPKGSCCALTREEKRLLDRALENAAKRLARR